MTQKLKAIELFDKYYRLFNNFPNYQYVIENINTIQDEKLYTAKQCALIAVEEIKEAIFWHPYESPNFELEYWNEVKQEIEKL